MSKWVTFWFETNCAFGLVDSPEKWKEMRKSWEKGAHGMKPHDIYTNNLSWDKVKPSADDTPNFGRRREHLGGKMTLGEFFDKNGMER